jgi:hypothetical protein
LLYYNARFYAPTLGRFISADTIIPNPANPQSYNRYSYGRNRPLNFNDPTGHRECDIATGDCSGGPGSFTPVPTPAPLIDFTGLDWTAEEKAVVNSGAWQVAKMLYEAGGGQFSSPREAFFAVYGGAVTFEKWYSEGSLGWANKENHVYVNIHKGSADITGPKAGPMWAAHELGHAFNYELAPNQTEPNYTHGQGLIDLAQQGVGVNGVPISGATSRTSWLGDYTRDFRGYQSNTFPHIQNPAANASEDFADMFFNYAYNSFTSDVYGRERYNFMSNHMSGWIALAVSNNE